MNKSEFQAYTEQAINGNIADSENPIFAFQSGIPTDLLSKIATGEINAQELAMRILETRGCDRNGKLIGFGKPARAYSHPY